MTTANIARVGAEIERKRGRLMVRALDRGVYENFGQKEVRELSDTFEDISDFSDEMNTIRQMISSFDEWCANYEGWIK